MIETKAEKEQQGSRENFRQRRFSYRSSPVFSESPHQAVAWKFLI